jgi:hypothetical protein
LRINEKLSGMVRAHISLPFLMHIWHLEAITVVQSLTSQSPDIQKILAFEGAFEKLFNIVTSEGGIDGGVIVFEAMSTVETLLRFNTPNQVSQLSQSLTNCLLVLYRAISGKLSSLLSFVIFSNTQQH